MAVGRSDSHRRFYCCQREKQDPCPMFGPHLAAKGQEHNEISWIQPFLLTINNKDFRAFPIVHQQDHPQLPSTEHIWHFLNDSGFYFLFLSLSHVLSESTPCLQLITFYFILWLSLLCDLDVCYLLSSPMIISHLWTLSVFGGQEPCLALLWLLAQFCTQVVHHK